MDPILQENATIKVTPLEARDWFKVTGSSSDVEVFTRVREDETGRRVIREIVVRSDKRVASDDLHRIPLSAVERHLNGLGANPDDLQVQELDPLRRHPDDTPDTFAERVAQHYRIYSAVSRSPAVLIAEKAEIPVSRVHRWVRETRKLGKLPPGRPGSAG